MALITLLGSNPPRSVEEARSVITALEYAYGRPCVFPSNVGTHVPDRLEIFRCLVARSDERDNERTALGYTEEAFQNLLERLRKLDANGHASVTDGSLNGYGIEERCEMIRSAVKRIEAQEHVYVTIKDVRLARSHKYPILIKAGTRVMKEGENEFWVYCKVNNYQVPSECVARISGAGSL